MPTGVMSQNNPARLIKIQKNIDDLRRLLGPEDSLLDAGCCEGHLYEHIGHKKYTGIDFWQPNIEKAKSRAPGVRFETADILRLTEQWDVVFCCRVLMHLPNYEENIKALRRIAKRKLIVCVPIGQSYVSVELAKGGVVEFRSYSKAQIEATNPVSIIKHEPYSTVVYDSSLS